MSRTSAGEHLRLMDQRIREQGDKIEMLRLSGADTSQAKQRLKLLQHALDEMRAQLVPLSPTPLDGKRQKGKMPSQRKK